MGSFHGVAPGHLSLTVSPSRWERPSLCPAFVGGSVWLHVSPRQRPLWQPLHHPTGAHPVPEPSLHHDVTHVQVRYAQLHPTLPRCH